MVIKKSNKRVRNNHAKKTRPVVRYNNNNNNNNNNNRQNHAETQDGGMILGFDDIVSRIGQPYIQEIINRLFVGICGVASTRDGDFLAGTGEIMYADIGGTLTKIDGKTNEYRLETPFGIERDGRRSDKPVYSKPATNTFLLTPTEAELVEYKQQAATVNNEIWNGLIIDKIYAGKISEVNGLLDSVNDRVIKFSIATSTTLSIGKIPDFTAARHTLLYVASRSPTADKAMVEALIQNGCIVNQPNPPRAAGKRSDKDDWTSGANVTPIWGAVKTMCDDVSQDVITKKKELVITLIRYGANVQAIHPTGLRIRAFIVGIKPKFFENDRHFETYFTLRAPFFDPDRENDGWTAVNHEKLANVTKYTKTVGRADALYNQQDYVTHQYPISKYDDLPKIESHATDYTNRMIAEAERVQKCLENPVESGVDVYGAVCFGIDMNDLRRVFFKPDCNEVFSRFHDANEKEGTVISVPSMDYSHPSTIKTLVSGKIHFSERHKWGVSDDPDKMESVMYAACRSPFTTPDTIGKLIQLGFGVDVPNRLPRGRSVGDTSFGSTPLHGVVERLRWAISTENNNAEVVNCIQIIGLLQQFGANVTAENNIILSSGKVSKMTASQEFEHVKNDNPFVYNIDKVGELLTTRVEKSLKWNSTTQPIANFYDGAKCTFAYNQGHHADPVHTDDYVNMTITSLQGAHGVGPTGVQLVISTVATPSKTVDKLVTAKIIDAAAAAPKPVAAAAASKFASNLAAKVADAAATAPKATTKVADAAATAPKATTIVAASSKHAAAPTTTEPKRVTANAVLDTGHQLYRSQLNEIIKRLNDKLKAEPNLYGWTPYYKDSSDQTGDKSNNPIEKMATKAYSSFSDVMTVALKFFSAKIDVLEYGKTTTPSATGNPEFKVWVAPMLLNKEFVDARKAEIKKMKTDATNADEVIKAHISARNLRQGDGKKDSFYDPMETDFKKNFPLYSDELNILMAYLAGLYRIDRNDSDTGFSSEDKLGVRVELKKRIDIELLIQNDIFIASLTQNFGNGTAQEYGYSGDTLIGFIINTTYETEQLAQAAIVVLATKTKLPADNFHPYQKYVPMPDPNTNPWQIQINSPLKMLFKSTYTWRWQPDDGKEWNSFDQEPTTLLEAAFKTGQPKVEYKARSWTFDLHEMTQTSSVGEKSSRGIFRQITGTTDTPAATAAKVATVVATKAPGKWQCQSDDGKKWISFGMSVNAALEDAYEYNIPRITIVTKNPAPQPAKGSETVTWWFDMKNSLQINTTTFSSRTIKREPSLVKSFQKDDFTGGKVDWYLGDVKSAEQTSVDIEKQYQANKTATSVTIGENTFNFATMMGIKSTVGFVLTRVCFDPPRFTDVQGKALNFDTSKKPETQYIMTVDQFCAMLREPDGINEKLIIALTEGRLTSEVFNSEFETTTGNGNTALYCACRLAKTTAYSIRRMVEELGLNVNLQNNGNKSTPLHGLVQRLKNNSDATQCVSIIAIMKFLVETGADSTIKNSAYSKTALQEFTDFTATEKAHLTGTQKAEITALLTHKSAAPSPVVASSAAAVASSAAAVATAVTPTPDQVTAAKDALSKLVTSAHVSDLRQLIKANNYSGNLKTYVDTVVSTSADLKSNIITAAKELKDTTVGDIEDAYDVVKVAAGSKGASFTIVGPQIDALTAPKSKLMDDSIVQVASQFNYLESMSSQYTEITEYYRDNTQGPRASVASLEALILRDAAIKPTASGGQLGKLGQQPIFNGISWYQNGYLTPRGVPEQDVNIAVTRIEANIRILRILAQASISESSTTKTQYIQVFSAAPSFQIGNQAQSFPPDKDSVYDRICETLVLAQYKSIAKLAVIKSIAEPSKPINLHLTAVGQGAFSNHPSLYDKFIAAVWNIVKPFNVSVYMHVYGSGTDQYDPRVTALNDIFTTIGPSAKKAGGKLPQLSAEQFIAHT